MDDAKLHSQIKNANLGLKDSVAEEKKQDPFSKKQTADKQHTLLRK
jgi:hypothetical protein